MAGVAGSSVGLGGIVSQSDFNGEWDDLQGPIEMANGATALTFEQYRDTPFNKHFFKHNQSEILYQTYQLKHGWKVGSEARLHIHCIPMSTWVGAPATKAVIIEVAYCWSVTGQKVPAAIGWTIVPVTLNFTAAQQYDEMILGLVHLTPPALARESSLIYVRIRRLTADIGDTYKDNKDHGTGAANLAVSDLDCHIQFVKAGTPSDVPEP